MVKLKLQLPEGFLDEEERCGYLVTHQAKELWAVLLDLFAEFDRVCKKHGIIYFASGGTMLGAVRHKGFIPWDDDIDLMMFRDQYERLCKIAPKEFKHPYFFQTQYTDFGTLRGHAQLRNSETTAILSGEKKYKYRFNQGVFIDIFPLDTVIDDPALFEQQYQDAERYKGKASNWASWSPCRLSKESEAFKGIKFDIKRFVGRLSYPIIKLMTNYYYKKFEETCQRYNYLSDTKMISTLSFYFNKPLHFKYRADYLSTVDMPFEFLTIPVGSNFDSGLHKRYGDYKTIVMGSSDHGGTIIDVDKPYTEYIR